jgi:hypothetical protein
MEQAMGADLGGVRLHTDTRADRLARTLHARAFTTGQDIFFRRGEPGIAGGEGRHVLAHELAHVAQQSAAGGCAVPGLQCLFGFELELALPVTSGPAGSELPPVKADKPKPRGAGGETVKSPTIGEMHGGGAARLDVDHSTRFNRLRPASWPAQDMTIVEVVTEPLDEIALTLGEVKMRMKTVGRWAQSLVDRTKGGRRPVDQFLAADPANQNYLGPPQGHENDGAIDASAYVQETYGLPLHKVQAEFAERSHDVSTMAAKPSWYRPLMLASWEKGKVGDALAAMGDLGSDPARDDMRGLLALMAYYASMSLQPDTRGLGKNKAGIFYYKTQLSTVREQLATKHSAIRDRLDEAATREAVSTALVGVGDAEMFSGGGVKAREWVEDVLRPGGRDQVFEKTANVYSSELTAPALGPPDRPRIGIVAENRDFSTADTSGQKATFGPSAKKHYAPSEWPGIAERLYRRLRKLHEMPV